MEEATRIVAMRHVLEFLVESLEAGRRVVDRAPSRDDLLLEMASGELNGAEDLSPASCWNRPEAAGRTYMELVGAACFSVDDGPPLLDDCEPFGEKPILRVGSSRVVHPAEDVEHEGGEER